jgi:cysteine synthase A
MKLKRFALNIIFNLKQDQDIELGGSSGINITGAIKLAKQMGPGHNIVTILCDPGKRYASKIYNREFLKSKNLPIPNWL